MSDCSNEKVDKVEENTCLSIENGGSMDVEGEGEAGSKIKKVLLATAKWTRFPVRARPHINPLNDDSYDHPDIPAHVNWKEMYPKYAETTKEVEILDVGCAYGGLLCNLSTVIPDSLMLGIEIRIKVAEFAQQRIQTLRKESGDQVSFQNIWIIASNAMKYLPYYFKKGQLKKMFFCFPDPHYKRKNHRRRIISKQLLAEYAYCLASGGLLYTITDVKDLGEWMQLHLDEHPLFERVNHEMELKDDPVLPFIGRASEDAQRTNEKKLDKYLAVFRRK